MPADRESARKIGAPYMFDMNAAERSMSAFVDEHAPDSMPVRPDAFDYEICMKARSLANDVVLRALGLDVAQALVVAARTCAAYGVPIPAVDDPAQQVLRVKRELLWRRQPRRPHIRTLEHSNIRLHYVHYEAERMRAMRPCAGPSRRTGATWPRSNRSHWKTNSAIVPAAQRRVARSAVGDDAVRCS